MVRFRKDLGRYVRVGTIEAHWHVAGRLKGLANLEVALMDLDIFGAGWMSDETSLKLCCGEF